MLRRPAVPTAPAARRGLFCLLLAVPLALTGCTSVEVAVDSPQQQPAPAAASPSSSDASAPRSVAAAEPAATRTFTTPDGAYRFEHPAEWTVRADPAEAGVYAVRDGSGRLMAGLAIGDRADPVASPVHPVSAHTSVDVPGLAGPLGRPVSAVVGLFPGQTVGGEAVAFGLADGGDPAANYGRVRSDDASFVYFGGTRAIGNGATMLSQAAVDREIDAYTASPEGRAVVAMLASFTVDTSVTGSVCRDGDYVYTDLRGLGCDEAQGVVGELRASGSAEDDQSVVSDEYYCSGDGVEETAYHDPMYACGVVGAADVSFLLDPVTITADHPLLHVETGPTISAPEEMTDVAADCVGVNYEFTEVDGLTCPEAKGMLQPFLEGKGTPADSDGQVLDDTQCTRAPAERGGATVPSWSCFREQGGSFVAYARM